MQNLVRYASSSRRRGSPALRERLDEAIELLVRAAGPGDLVLLLDAQGMDAAAAVLERQLLG